MSIPKNSLIVYVDVDDTLVRSVGSKRIPIVRVIEHVKQLHSQGAKLYCWSSGGGEYARASAIELGIENCFEGFIPKPNVLVDDQIIEEWRLCIEVHPLSVDATSPAQYWEHITNKN